MSVSSRQSASGGLRLLWLLRMQVPLGDLCRRAAPFFRRLAAAGCRIAELGDREEELATVAEFALLIGPGLSLLAHPALVGHVLLKQRHERAAIGIGDQLGRREGVSVHPDVLEARVA